MLPPGKKRKLSHIPSAACQLLKPSEFLQDIFLSCSNIRELEITSSGVETPIDSKCWIDGEDLNAISECANLVSLTLGHFFITDGQFIEEVTCKFKAVVDVNKTHVFFYVLDPEEVF